MECSRARTQSSSWWRTNATLTTAAVATAAAAGTLGETLFKCHTSGTCIGSSVLGASNRTQGMPPYDEQCAPGYTGVVCAVCSSNYTRRNRLYVL